MTRPRLSFEIRIDKSRGRRKWYKGRELGECHGTLHRNTSRNVKIVIDLEANWKNPRHEARRNHRSQFRLFMEELLDTIDHEVTHAFQPVRLPSRAAEREAEAFALAGRLSRSR